MGPRGSEKPYLKIFLGRDPELGTSLTPSESHGTKIFCSKIFSYDENTMLFYGIFCGLNSSFMPKTGNFSLFAP